MALKVAHYYSLLIQNCKGSQIGWSVSTVTLLFLPDQMRAVSCVTFFSEAEKAAASGRLFLPVCIKIFHAPY